MPIPLPNLDTRHWADLVEEGRAQIPVSAPEWTDHNLHDPGITFVELMAWVVEAAIYRANAVPDRHLRKFLALAGFPVRGTHPSSVVVSLSPPGGTPLTVPAGARLHRVDGEVEPLEVVTERETVIVPTRLATAHTFDGEDWIDWSDRLDGRADVHLFGPDPAGTSDPDRSPAVYLGFSDPLSPVHPFSLHLGIEGDRPGDRAALMREWEADARACAPPVTSCGPAPSASVDDVSDSADSSAGTPPIVPSMVRAHHGVRAVWEWRAPDGWRTFDQPGSLEDDTRLFSRDGFVRIRVPGPMEPLLLGDDEDRGRPFFYVRCRMVHGRPDLAPRVRTLQGNAVAAVQCAARVDTLPIAPGAIAPPALPVGPVSGLALRTGADGRAVEVATGVPGAPDARVLEYRPPAPGTPGLLRSTLVRVATDDGVPGLLGTGLPHARGHLSGAPIDSTSPRLWSFEVTPTGGNIRAWREVPDFDASGTQDTVWTLDPDTGEVTFGSGVRGVVPPPGASLVASYRTTRGRAGNAAAGGRWLLEADDYNRSVFHGHVLPPEGLMGTNAAPGSGGEDPETIRAAALRAAAALWAHERLVQLTEAREVDTLDRVHRSVVVALAEPARATGALDFERLALTVPGTAVRRARAFVGHDPRLGCLSAPGTVTLVILPALPLGRPEPTGGLLERIRRSLAPRRILGTRLVVTGPRYVDLDISVDVRLLPGADGPATEDRIRSSLASYLDPLTGGRDGLGWPFGRDVLLPELLREVDQVPGVDHVRELTLDAAGNGASCDTVCLAPTALPAVGHIEVRSVRP